MIKISRGDQINIAKALRDGAKEAGLSLDQRRVIVGHVADSMGEKLDVETFEAFALSPFGDA